MIHACMHKLSKITKLSKISCKKYIFKKITAAAPLDAWTENVFAYFMTVSHSFCTCSDYVFVFCSSKEK